MRGIRSKLASPFHALRLEGLREPDLKITLDGNFGSPRRKHWDREQPQFGVSISTPPAKRIAQRLQTFESWCVSRRRLDV
jgi:hypothetical protein